jgi:uncharacterized protein with PQ loop repeat
MTKTIALIAALILPLWNIPLIVRIVKRKSSQDISTHWAIGVWSCFLLMAPEGLRSVDLVWKTFNIVNLVVFTAVVVTVLIYKKGDRKR